MPDSTLCQEPKQPKLLDQVRQYLRFHHYSIHTERSYVDWIVRFIRFYRMRSRDDLFHAEPKIEAFLIHLDMEGNVGGAVTAKGPSMKAPAPERCFRGRGVLRKLGRSGSELLSVTPSETGSPAPGPGRRSP